jgi:hypothetical protein
VLAASAPPRADPSMVLSHVSSGWEGTDRSSYAAVAPRVSVAGLRVPQPARLRRGQYGVEAMEVRDHVITYTYINILYVCTCVIIFVDRFWDICDV